MCRFYDVVDVPDPSHSARCAIADFAESAGDSGGWSPHLDPRPPSAPTAPACPSPTPALTAVWRTSSDRDLQYYLIHLAEALARPGKQRDLDAAAGKGIEAIHLTERLSSTLNVDCIRGLIRKLKPYAQVPAVRDFLERARAFAERYSRN